MKLIYVVLFVFLSISSHSSDWNEFKIKRENNFKFTKDPVLEKKNDNEIFVSFETASFCDVTVVIEEKGTKKIIRHLACGVLGKNAPKPFVKNTKKQNIFWDVKDDKGRYIKDISNIQFRVSLGLNPLYDKSLFNSPEQRFGTSVMRIKSTKAGVYVYDGGDSWDFVKLYSHTGNYIKTIYPLSAKIMSRTKGLDMRIKPDGKGEFPVKVNFVQNSFFKDSNNYGFGKNGSRGQPNKKKHYGMFGKGASYLAVNNDLAVLGMSRLHVIGLKKTDLSFYGSVVSEEVALRRRKVLIEPKSAALSPDGSKLYLTGYHFCQFVAASAKGVYYNKNWDTLNMVKVVDLKTGKSTIFKGTNKLNTPGSDNSSFSIPICVTTDSKGRVYVADFYNDRVQVYSADRKFLKSIKTIRPTYVTVLNKSKNIVIATYGLEANKKKIQNKGKKPVVLSFFESFENPVLKLTVTLPKSFITRPALELYGGEGIKIGLNVNDDSGDVMIWACKENPARTAFNSKRNFDSNIAVFKLNNKKVTLVKSFHKEATEKLKITKVNRFGRNRIYVNPKTGNLFMPISMTGFEGKAFKILLEINPKSEKITQHKTFFCAEDMAFDADGFIYLKSINLLARFDIKEWKEVPFDYGIEANASTSTLADRQIGKVVSAIKLPLASGWHHGGFYVTPKGRIIVSGIYEEELNIKFAGAFQGYKGRNGYSRTVHLVHIFDKHGHAIMLDLLKGLTDIYGVGMDDDLNYYVMSGATRILDGKKYQNRWTGTLLKFPLKPSKVLTTSKNIPLPLDPSSYPEKVADVAKGGQKFWVNDAEWFFGGVGFAGKNAGTGCACFNARMTFDYLNRSFVPELERYSVAVLDSAGNLICRIGKYGNANSQGANSSEPLGGDEVGLVHGAYLATLTDKKLYIADQANSRIVSVSLGYHVNKIITLID